MGQHHNLHELLPLHLRRGVSLHSCVMSGLQPSVLWMAWVRCFVFNVFASGPPVSPLFAIALLQDVLGEEPPALAIGSGLWTAHNER